MVTIIANGLTLTGTVTHIGPVVAYVETDHGTALVTVDELRAWNPGRDCYPGCITCQPATDGETE